MKILIACESSGTIRRELAAYGHDVVSCDLLPSEDNSPDHYTGPVQDLLTGSDARAWDLMIGHPPCTYLSSSGLFRNKGNPERAAKTEAALAFFRYLWEQPIPRIVLENPIGCASTRICKPTQIIQPYMFGDDASKSTCLWIKGLPKLEVPPESEWFPPRLVVAENGRTYKRWSNQTDSGQNRLTPSEDRWRIRSKTYAGIANAIGQQWGTVEALKVAA